MTLEVFLKINKNQIYGVLPRIVDWVKINVDGAFVEQTGGAGIDILARDHLRIVCLSAWRVPFHCTSLIVPVLKLYTWLLNGYICL